MIKHSILFIYFTKVDELKQKSVGRYYNKSSLIPYLSNQEYGGEVVASHNPLTMIWTWWFVAFIARKVDKKNRVE